MKFRRVSFYRRKEHVMKKRKIKRGQIYMAKLDPAVGSEQNGDRPVLIVQTNYLNRNSPTVTVVTISSKVHKRRDLPVHVIVRCVGLPKNSIALAEQIRTLDKSRLTKYMGNASQSTMERIDHALKFSTGVDKKCRTSRVNK